MSISLYNTFGNEVKTRVNQQTLSRYLQDATIKFALPEATSQLLAELEIPQSINKALFDAVVSKLENLGFQPANARSMASILLPVAEKQGVSPMEYFTDSDAALKLAIDTYDALNILRPPGNRIGLASAPPTNRTGVQQLIRP